MIYMYDPKPIFSGKAGLLDSKNGARRSSSLYGEDHNSSVCHHQRGALSQRQAKKARAIFSLIERRTSPYAAVARTGLALCFLAL